MTDHSDSTALAKFTAALLEPLPEPILVDTHHNRLLRRARRETWHKNEARMNYFETAVAFGNAAYRYAAIGGNIQEARKLNTRTVGELMPNLWQAITNMMLTPAPDRRAVEWKKTAMRGNKPNYLFLRFGADLGEHRSFVASLQAAIDADEAWLAAHPTRRLAARP